HPQPHSLTCSTAHTHPPSLQLFQVMAARLPQLCHHKQSPFPFPDTLLHTNHPQQATTNSLHILQHLFANLRSHSTPHHWNAQARHHLLNNLQCYIHHLEQCMPANGMLFKGQGLHNLLLRINKYFGHIQLWHKSTHLHHSPRTMTTPSLERKEGMNVQHSN
uniref:Interferon n=1 Tax=Amazona collaria TaxID=241587 RepID=A0A8B9GC27_9PSIT